MNVDIFLQKGEKMMKETCGKAKTFWQKAAVLVLSLLVGLTAVTPMLSAKTEKVSAADMRL